MVEWQVINIETATKNQPKTLTVVATFPTRAEAEAWRRREDPRGEISVGIREAPTEPEPIVQGGLGAGLARLGGPLGALAEESRREAKKKQEVRLAEQAAEKIESGQTISTAEREALTRTYRDKIPSTSEINRQIREARGEITVTPRELEKIKATEREQRIIETKKKIIDFQPPQKPSLSTGGVSLTFLGIPYRMEVQPIPEPTLKERFEAGKQMSAFELAKRGYRASEKLASPVMEAVGEYGINVPTRFITGIVERPVGKAQYREEIVRKTALSGRVISEKRKIVESKEPRLFPVIEETLTPVAEGLGELIGEGAELIKKIPAGIELISSKEFRQKSTKVAQTTAVQFVSEPVKTIKGASLVGGVIGYKLIKGTAEHIKEQPLTSIGELIALETGLRTVKFGIEGTATTIRGTQDIFIRKQKLSLMESGKGKVGKMFEIESFSKGNGFELKPFIKIQEIEPAFLQRTLSGDVITSQEQRFFTTKLGEVDFPMKLPRGTMPKDIEIMPPKTVETPASLDIFNPEIEAKILRDITIPSGIGKKEAQTQLRRSFSTRQQRLISTIEELRGLYPKEIPIEIQTQFGIIAKVPPEKIQKPLISPFEYLRDKPIDTGIFKISKPRTKKQVDR